LSWNPYDHCTLRLGIKDAVGFLQLPLTGRKFDERIVKISLAP